MNEKFSQHPGQILREDRLGLFTPSPFLPVHFHWTTTSPILDAWVPVFLVLKLWPAVCGTHEYRVMFGSQASSFASITRRLRTNSV